VAIGVAVQAAATLRGETPRDVAARWQTDRGALLASHRSVRQLAFEAAQSNPAAR
jgi:hypothetical protein